jgi:hypothetical protein
VFEGYHQIFSDGLMSDLDDSWDRWVRPLVPGDLSKISIVIGDLKAYLLVV